MRDLLQVRPAPERPHSAPQPPEPTGDICRRANVNDDAATTCPSCGSGMRLWANYHRCSNCGYKESCCF